MRSDWRRAVLAWALAGIGCAGAAREADRPFQGGLARVEQVDVQVQAGSVQPLVRAVARGTLPDPCTRIHGQQRERRGRRILITLTTRRDARGACPGPPRPFSRGLSIPTAHLDEGLYTLEVNGASADFEVPAIPDLQPAGREPWERLD